MELTPSELDRLLIFTAAQVARARRERGVLLNVPEATALIADAVIESARAGATHSEALAAGAAAVSATDLEPLRGIEGGGDLRTGAEGFGHCRAGSQR